MFARIPHRHPLWSFGSTREGRAVRCLSPNIAGRRWKSDDQKPSQTGMPRPSIPSHGHTTKAEKIARERSRHNLCVRCGSNAHQEIECPYLEAGSKDFVANALGLTVSGEDQTREILFGKRKKGSKYLYPIPSTSNSAAISNPLGLTGSGEDQTREILFGKIELPKRYAFLDEPSPTRNNHAVRGQITTSAAAPSTSESSASPGRDANAQNDGSIAHQESESVYQRTWAIPKNLQKAWQTIAEEEENMKVAKAKPNHAKSEAQTQRHQNRSTPPKRQDQSTNATDMASRFKAILDNMDKIEDASPGPSKASVTAEPKACEKPADKGFYIVGMWNLSLHIVKEALETEFARFGKVDYANIVVHHGTDRPKGIGFVKFKEADAAKRAVAAMNGSKFNDREIGVRPFKSVRNVKAWARSADPVTGRPKKSVEKDSSLKALEMDTSIANTPMQDFSRVHILGTNTLGKLAAHSLASMKERRSVSLLMFSETLIRKWKSEGENIILVRDGAADSRFGFDVERTTWTQAEYEEQSKAGTIMADQPWMIKQLIITSSGWDTIASLLNIRDRLDSSSSIMFLQNIEGVMDMVNERVFQNPATRPQYIRTFSTHGLMNHPERAFAVKHHEVKEIIMRHADDLPLWQLAEEHPSAYDLIKLFQKSEALCGQVPRKTSLLMYHKLQRLAVDAVLGPLCVAFDCKILDLRYNYVVSQNMRAMLEEICAVIWRLPEAQELLATYDVFGRTTMRYFVPGYLMKSLACVCDEMQQDQAHPLAKKVEMGHRTDIHFVNGYFIAQAKKLGIKMPVNEFVERMVKAKSAMKRKRVTGWIPFAKGKPEGEIEKPQGEVENFRKYDPAAVAAENEGDDYNPPAIVKAGQDLGAYAARIPRNSEFAREGEHVRWQAEAEMESQRRYDPSTNADAGEGQEAYKSGSDEPEFDRATQWQPMGKNWEDVESRPSTIERSEPPKPLAQSPAKENYRAARSNWNRVR